MIYDDMVCTQTPPVPQVTWVQLVASGGHVLLDSFVIGVLRRHSCLDFDISMSCAQQLHFKHRVYVYRQAYSISC